MESKFDAIYAGTVRAPMGSRGGTGTCLPSGPPLSEAAQRGPDRGPGNHRQDDPVSSVEISSSRARCGVAPLCFALKDEQYACAPVCVSALPTLPSALAHCRARHEASGVTPRGIEVADEQETRPD